MNTGKAFEILAREVLFYEFDDFCLDVRKETLRKNKEPLSITHKAFQVLLILVQNFGQTVEKEYIYEQLWGDSFVEDANLTQHIYILRKTLGQNTEGESYIETVARSGYRFTVPVRTVSATSPISLSEPSKVQPPGECEKSLPDIPLPERPRLTLLKNLAVEAGLDPQHVSYAPDTDATAAAASMHERIGTNRLFLLSALAVGLLIAGGLLVRSYVSKPLVGGPEAVQPKSIAVLPFKTIGDESANEKLGLGMADAVITRLARLKTIPVRPTSSIFHYTDKPPESSLAAGHEMGVDTVLEGTVQRDADRVRVSVRLIDVSDGNTVWADNFDENFTNIFKMQDSISSKVVSALRVKLTPQEESALSQHSTSSTAAYQAYQQGVYFGNTRTKDGLEKAVTYFQQAIDADQNYGRAYAMLADSYNMLAYYHFADPYEMRKRSSEAATKALSLDDNIAETYIALAFLKMNEDGGMDAAKELLEKAIAIAPYNSTAHVRYGWLLLNSRGDLNATAEQMRLAQQYDPASGVSNGALCDVLSFQGKFDEAIKHCEKSVEINPELDAAQMALAEVYFAGGRRDDAMKLAEKVVAKSQGSDRLSMLGSLGYFNAKLGNKDRAREIIAEIKPSAAQMPFLLNDLVVINYALGNTDEGFNYFQQLMDKSFIPFRFYYDPLWADVRADSRTVGLAKKRMAGM